MEAALVLSEEKAAEAGLSSSGPFAFGAFPGVYFVGVPVSVSELGFESAEAALAAVEETGAPLEATEVADGEGKAYRTNHALSEREARAGVAEKVVEDVAGGKINSHAEADAVAVELGITFPEGAKLAEKVSAIETVRAGGTADEAEAELADEAALEDGTE